MIVCCVFITALFFVQEVRCLKPKNCDSSLNSLFREGILGQVGMFPWLGVIRVELHEGVNIRVALTGAIIIKEKYALTIADDIARIPKKIFERDSRALFIPRDGEPWLIKLKNYITHPEYPYIKNTIALVKLELENERTMPLIPICWQTYSYDASSQLYVMGITDVNDVLEKEVHKVQYVQQSKCMEWYEAKGFNTEGDESTDYQCVSAVNSKKQCVFETGMVLASNTTGTWTLLGFGIYGPGCASPSRFIVMYKYFPWIESTTNEQTGRSYGKNKGFRDQNVPIHQMFRSKSEPENIVPYFPLYYEFGLAPEVVRVDRTAIAIFSTKYERDQGDCFIKSSLIYSDSFKIRADFQVGRAYYVLSLMDLTVMNYTCVLVRVNARTRSNATLWYNYGDYIEPLEGLETPKELLKKYPLPKRDEEIEDQTSKTEKSRGDLNPTTTPVHTGEDKNPNTIPENSEEDKNPNTIPENSEEDKNPNTIPENSEEDKNPNIIPANSGEDKNPNIIPANSGEDKNPNIIPENSGEDKNPNTRPESSGEGKSPDSSLEISGEDKNPNTVPKSSEENLRRHTRRIINSNRRYKKLISDSLIHDLQAIKSELDTTKMELNTSGKADINKTFKKMFEIKSQLNKVQDKLGRHVPASLKDSIHILDKAASELRAGQVYYEGKLMDIRKQEIQKSIDLIKEFREQPEIDKMKTQHKKETFEKPRPRGRQGKNKGWKPHKHLEKEYITDRPGWWMYHPHLNLELDFEFDEEAEMTIEVWSYRKVIPPTEEPKVEFITRTRTAPSTTPPEEINMDILIAKIDRNKLPPRLSFDNATSLFKAIFPKKVPGDTTLETLPSFIDSDKLPPDLDHSNATYLVLMVFEGLLPSESSDAGNDTLTSPDAGKDTLTSPDAGKDTLTSPDAGKDTLTSPDAGKDTLTSPDAGKDTLNSPDAGKDTLTSPDAGKDTLNSPNAGKDTLTSPDAGKNTLTSPHGPLPQNVDDTVRYKSELKRYLRKDSKFERYSELKRAQYYDDIINIRGIDFDDNQPDKSDINRSDRSFFVVIVLYILLSNLDVM